MCLGELGKGNLYVGEDTYRNDVIMTKKVSPFVFGLV